MAGAMRKMAVYLGLVEDDRYDDYDDDEYADRRATDRADRADRSERTDRADRAERADRGEGRSRPLPAVREEQGRDVRDLSRSGATVASMTDRRPSVVAVPSAQPAPAPSPEVRITTIHPRTYNEAKTIGETFRDGIPVIMNLTEMDDADAKRLVDFAAGLVFGLRGTIERVTNKVFLLSPANVTVTAEDKARMAESGFFNQS